MAALVQSYSQQSTSVAMLQPRPSSASGMLQTSSPSHSLQQYPNTTIQSSTFQPINNGTGMSGYRRYASGSPIAPYAFTSTPNLASQTLGQPGPYLRMEQRTSSAPTVPQAQQFHSVNRTRYPPASSTSTTSSTSSSDLSNGRISMARDDVQILPPLRDSPGHFRSQSALVTSVPLNLVPPKVSSPLKVSPDRYRRSNNRRPEHSNTTPTGTTPGHSSFTSHTLPNVMRFYGAGTGQVTPDITPVATGPIHATGTTVDDFHLNRPIHEQAKRYRRRSIHTIDGSDYSLGDVHLGTTAPAPQGLRHLSSANDRFDQQLLQQQPQPVRGSPITAKRPSSSHGRNGSSESAKSNRSLRPDFADKRESIPVAPADPAQGIAPSPLTKSPAEKPATQSDAPRLVNIPPRASSTDAAKRIAKPSPLSKPMTMNPEPPASKGSFASAVNAAIQSSSGPTYVQVANGTESSAAKQLAALNEKGSKKSKTSRLRRAFSFGSAQELRKASAENVAANNALGFDRSPLRKDNFADDHDGEQARIARRQEAGGIGSGIYNGQGNFFTGSTDNLSISSTASSASVMIRKMGKGMKKSTRSLVGLFRPKSVIGVPAADAALPEASQAQVSMVTVEAEREKINVNPNPHDQAGGGTGFPRLERNSIDAAAAARDRTERLGSSGTETSSARRSIVGEKERAEVLAAVKKGILKRSGTDSGNSSPSIRPTDSKTQAFQLPHIPHVNESPSSSGPTTPVDEQQGHRRTGSVALGNEDYFMASLRLHGSAKSAPSTPQGTIKRNATFSPRIQFHDTWPSGEYDRRGEIATCNRLTPMLAQQIKEELNTFKMEMEVHENSKIYTHFF